MSKSFEDLLKTKMDDVVEPTALPEGLYEATILSYTSGQSKVKNTPYFELNLRLSGILDVDEEAFNAYGGMANLAERTFGIKYYLTPKADFMWRNMFLSLGLTKKTLGDNLADCINADVVALVKHEEMRSTTGEPARFIARVQSLRGTKAE